MHSNEMIRQIQGAVPVPGQDHYTGMIDCFQKIIRNEGYIIYNAIDIIVG